MMTTMMPTAATAATTTTTRHCDGGDSGDDAEDKGDHDSWHDGSTTRQKDGNVFGSAVAGDHDQTSRGDSEDEDEDEDDAEEDAYIEIGDVDITVSPRTQQSLASKLENTQERSNYQRKLGMIFDILDFTEAESAPELPAMTDGMRKGDHGAHTLRGITNYGIVNLSDIDDDDDDDDGNIVTSSLRPSSQENSPSMDAHTIAAQGLIRGDSGSSSDLYSDSDTEDRQHAATSGYDDVLPHATEVAQNHHAAAPSVSGTTSPCERPPHQKPPRKAKSRRASALHLAMGPSQMQNDAMLALPHIWNTKVKRQDIDSLLLPLKNGCFLLRNSHSQRGKMVLCVKFDTIVLHYLIHRFDGMVAGTNVTGAVHLTRSALVFPSIIHLVTYFSQTRGPLPCCLRLQWQRHLPFPTAASPTASTLRTLNGPRADDTASLSASQHRRRLQTLPSRPLSTPSARDQLARDVLSPGSDIGEPALLPLSQALRQDNSAQQPQAAPTGTLKMQRPLSDESSFHVKKPKKRASPFRRGLSKSISLRSVSGRFGKSRGSEGFSTDVSSCDHDRPRPPLSISAPMTNVEFLEKFPTPPRKLHLVRSLPRRTLKTLSSLVPRRFVTSGARRVTRHIRRRVTSKQGTEGRTIRNFIECTQQTDAITADATLVFKSIRQFIDGMRNFFSVQYGPKYNEWLAEDDDGETHESILEAVLQDAICRPLHDYLAAVAITSCAMRGDLRAYKQNMLLLAKGRPADIGMKKELASLSWEDAIAHLREIPDCRTPIHKLQRILFFIDAVHEILEKEHAVHGMSRFSADDMLPLVIYLTLQTRIVEFEAECEVMWGLIEPGLLNGEAGYYLTTFTSAVQAIKTFNPQSVPHLRVPLLSDIQGVLRVYFLSGLVDTVFKTVPVHAHTSAASLCRQICEKYHISPLSDFCLYEKTPEESHLRRLEDAEDPLALKAMWPLDREEDAFQIVFGARGHLGGLS